MVYFVQAGLYIKIGRTHDIADRLRKIQCESPFDLRVLAIYQKAGKAEERQIQEQFKSFRVRAQWFKFCKEIIEYIISESKITLQVDIADLAIIKDQNGQVIINNNDNVEARQERGIKERQDIDDFRTNRVQKERWRTVYQMADFIGKSKRTVYRWAKAGRLQEKYKGTKRVFRISEKASIAYPKQYQEELEAENERLRAKVVELKKKLSHRYMPLAGERKRHDIYAPTAFAEFEKGI